MAFLDRENAKEVQEMRELRIATRKNNPIHNDVQENTTFLLLYQKKKKRIYIINKKNNKENQKMKKLRITTRKTNPIHNDVPKNTTFLLLDQPSEEANTTGTLISKIDEVTINAKTANWKAIVIFVI